MTTGKRAVLAHLVECLAVIAGVLVLIAATGLVVCLFLPGLPFRFGWMRWMLPFVAGLLLAGRYLRPAKPVSVAVTRLIHAPVWVWIAAYAVVLSAVSIRKHAALESHGSDLGIFVNLFWNLTHGGGWYSGMLERHFLGEHFSPVLLLVAPLFRLWPRAECLLVVQSVALALGAWPLYALARRRLGHGAGLVLLLAYCVYPPLLGVALHDFHEVALAVPLLSGVVWALDRDRTGWAVTLLGLSVLCKEDLALTAAAVGVWLMVRRDWKTGPVLALAGLGVFLLLTSVVIPAYRGSALPFSDRYSQFPGGLGVIPGMIVRDPVGSIAACWHPDKCGYVLDLLRPLGLLPVLSPVSCIPALPTLARNLLSNHEPQFSIYFHYPAPLIPFLFAAVVVAVERVGRIADRRLPARFRAFCMLGGRAPAPSVIPALCWLLFAAWLWGDSPWQRMDRFEPAHRTAAFRRLSEHVPPEVTVSAHNRLVPHLACRRELCTFPIVGGAEYVVLDLGYPGFEYPVHAETHRRRLHALLNEEGYEPVVSEEKFVLLKRTGRSVPMTTAQLSAFFLEFSEEQLLRVRDRSDVYIQGPSWTVPQGNWRIVVGLNLARNVPAGAPVTLSVHPFLGGRINEWSLADRVIDPASLPTAADRDPRRVAWEFVQPRRQVLSLRMHGRYARRVAVNSLELEPVDSGLVPGALVLPDCAVQELSNE